MGKKLRKKIDMNQQQQQQRRYILFFAKHFGCVGDVVSDPTNPV